MERRGILEELNAVFLIGQVGCTAARDCAGCSLLSPGAAVAIYVIVALMWLIPDRRFEGIDE